METTYAQKNDTVQKASANTAESVRDNSTQTQSLQRKADLMNGFDMVVQCARRKENTRKGEFKGNDRVPVIRINPRRVEQMLENCKAKGYRSVSQQILRNGFNISAGIHSGGLGGGGFGVDSESHITVQSGKSTYHLHVHKGIITSITGG